MGSHLVSDNVIALISQTGAYSYDPCDGNMTVSGPDAAANPYRYASAYLDPTTGLYKMGAGYYNPATGAFTQQDDPTHTGNLAQGDRYTYAGDDPINNLDPGGAGFLSSLGSDLGIASIASSVVGDTLDAVGFGEVGVFFDGPSVALSDASAGATCLGGSDDCEESLTTAAVDNLTFGDSYGLEGVSDIASSAVSGAGLAYDLAQE